MYCEKNDQKKIRKILVVVCFIMVVMLTLTVSAGETSTIGEGEKIPEFNCEEDFGVVKALAMLGSICGKNIVPSQGVNGQLAFRTLQDVTFEEAMDAILGEGFVYIEEGNLIKVYTRSEYENIMKNPERRVYKVFTLYYITAEEAVKLIEPAISEIAKVSSSTPAETEISGSSSGGSGGGSSLDSAGGGDSMALNDTIVVYDFPENIVEVEKMLDALDVKPKQVLVEATILSALLDEDTKLGFDWNFMGGYELDGFPAIAMDIGAPIETYGFAEVTDGLRIGVQSGPLFGFINALETVTDVTVLANPKILAINKQEGSVLIGQNLGYRSSTSVATSGVATEGEVEFLKTGTQLVFRPYIGKDGYIRMEIYPKDSSAELDADGVPQETTTELKTNIMVKNGETIVIGGLFRDVVNSSKYQVPILGDLPFIGPAFRGESSVTQREEVMIMLTPHIIEEPGDVNGKARLDDVHRKMVGANDELMPISRRKMADDNYALAAQLYLDGDNAGAMKHLKVALTLRPSYLEAIRLQERIIVEMNPDEGENFKRIEIETVDKKEAPKWRRQ